MNAPTKPVRLYQKDVELDATLILASLESPETAFSVARETYGLTPKQLAERLTWYKARPSAYRRRVIAKVEERLAEKDGAGLQSNDSDGVPTPTGSDPEPSGDNRGGANGVDQFDRGLVLSGVDEIPRVVSPEQFKRDVRRVRYPLRTTTDAEASKETEQ